MKTVAVSEKLFDKLSIISGKEFDEKLSSLLETNALMKLKECEDKIFEFEAIYGMDFEGFSDAWKQGSLQHKHSHKVERAFMEWEGFESERKKWLQFLHDMRLSG